MISLFPASAEALFTGCQTARQGQVRSPHLHQRPHCPSRHPARDLCLLRADPLNHGPGMTVTCGSCSGPWHDADSYCPQETVQWIADLRAWLADGVPKRISGFAPGGDAGSDERDVPVTANRGLNVP